ncbi:MAG TPA: DUF3048 domain-containing protein [Candidatus Saccharimonadales bacterium]|nr:DUF3048 domain-containing protein [Candidatus Saccharimonadales bacterium]
MDDNGAPLGRRKPKVIEPLPKPDRPPLPDLDNLEADSVAIDSSEEFPGVTPDAPKHKPELPDPPDTFHPAHSHPGHPWYKPVWPPTRLQLGIVGAVLILIAGGINLYVYTHRTPTPPPTPHYKKYVPPKPVITYSTLTGLPVAPSVNKLPVTGVMIENFYPDARPQSGLDQAGVVFEAIAEGGITRFLALYQDNSPSYVGPVRSARPYYLEWALGFDAGFAHVGGSPEALQDIKNWHVRDLDQFYNSGAYWRINSRYAPHNAYTSLAKLHTLEKSKGYTSSNYIGFVRNEKAAPSKSITAKNIDLTFSGYYYNVHYTYDKASNAYKRYEGGQPHVVVDANGHQTQLAPKVVLALVMPYHLEADGYHSYYNTIGSGQLYVFQDGTVIKGTWHKASRTSQFTFTDASGATIKLDPGQTWVSALASSGDVSYKP